ncbi:MAG: four helix bundle protein [bacterium]|nr:four helix bundle protein [bacterium]
MEPSVGLKRYDLEARTLQFTRDVISFVSALPRSIANIEIIKQLIRATGSVGANYIEANESVSRKDFLLRVKISKKESREAIYWLELVQCSNEQCEVRRRELIREATELMKILGSIVEKSSR